MPINIFLPQVTRIPIEGPAPFNTLVCVAGESTGGPQQVENGKLSRYPVQVGTGFKLAGFDQRVPPVFQHSTAAWLNALGPAHSGAFVYAVDRVTNVGFSAYDGSYSMNLDLALMPADTMWETCFPFFSDRIPFAFTTG